MLLTGIKSRSLKKQARALSIAPWPLEQYKMDYIKREWPLYNGRGSSAPPNLSHCGGEDTNLDRLDTMSAAQPLLQ